jgi:deazaflavin-dependent oxidoreductase (nitroreductase family)
MANPFAKSKTFHKVGNMLLTGQWRLLPTPKGLGLLTATGRTSGKRRQRAMRIVRDGDRAYAVALLGAKADWLKNVRRAPAVRVKLGGTTYDATAREVVAPDERQRFQEVYRPVAGWYDYFDYLTYVWGIPTRGKLLRVHDKWLAEGTPVVFELQP